MPKLILAGAFAATALALAACGYDEQEYNQANADYGADYNSGDANYADNGADYGNTDGNYTNDVGNLDNGADTNEAANEATTNTGY